ncbi:MAG: acyl-CoA dehydrogenase family protein [Bacillota bacterium]|nr:acyl-CoA dehydrogenase family protein [Bacillota bacterium]
MKLVISDYHLNKQKDYRSFADQEIDRTDLFPWENLRKAGKKGYMGLPIPKEFGGQGEDFLTYILLIEEISRVCASTGVIMAVHTSVGSFPLLYFGSREQREKYLPGLASGKLLGAFALTEAGAGSDAAALTTGAIRVEGGYRLNGCKLFITSGGEADIYTVFARSDKNAGSRGITAFLVEKDSIGLFPGKPEKKMGLNRSSTTEIRMEDLFVPLSNRLGAEGEGFSIAMSLLDGGRTGIAAQGLGLARASIEYAINYFKELERAGIRTGQNASFILADLATRLEAAKLLTYRAAVMKEAGNRTSKEASMAKMFATDLAMDAAVKCIDLCGDNDKLSQYFCDAKATQIYEGSNQIQRIVVAREILR